MFSEGDEEAVDLYPVFARQGGFESGHRELRGLCLDVAPAVGDSVDVDVHSDMRLAAGDSEDEVGALWTDAGE